MTALLPTASSSCCSQESLEFLFQVLGLCFLFLKDSYFFKNWNLYKSSCPCRAVSPRVSQRCSGPELQAWVSQPGSCCWQRALHISVVLVVFISADLWSVLLSSLSASPKDGVCGTGEHSTVVLEEPGDLSGNMVLHARGELWGGMCVSGSLEIKYNGHQTVKKFFLI